MLEVNSEDASLALDIDSLDTITLNMIDISQLLQSSACGTLADYLRNDFSQLSPTMQLRMVSEFFIRVEDMTEEMGSCVELIWRYVVEHKLWTIRFSDLTTFKEEVGYEFSIDPFLQHSKSMNTRINRYLRKLFRNWALGGIEELLTKPHMPSKVTYRLAVELSKLSDCCHDPLQGFALITKIRNTRVQQFPAVRSQDNHRSHLTEYITAVDVHEARIQLSKCKDLLILNRLMVR